MEPLWLLAIGFASGLAVGLFRSFRNTQSGEQPREQKRDENLEKLKKQLRGRETITNDEVEKLMGVSDATASRYLEALEAEGVLEQVGETGRGVHYRVR